MDKPITSFRGEYSWLSNFFPVTIRSSGITYCSVENAYQATKTLDPNLRLQFRYIPPRDAKRLGRTLELRRGWDTMKLRVMENLLRQKFSLLPLRNKLIETGTREIVEGNNWGDTYWGVTTQGVGHNHLGKLLMRIRSELPSRVGGIIV